MRPPYPIARIHVALTFCIALSGLACSTPSWVSEAENIASLSIPIVVSVGSIVDPAAAPAISSIGVGLNALADLLKKLNATKPDTSTLDQISATIFTINSNISDVLAVGQIKDPATQAKLTQILQLVSSEMSQIQKIVDANTMATRMGIKAGEKATVPAPLDPYTFKQQYNQIVGGDLRFPVLQ